MAGNYFARVGRFSRTHIEFLVAAGFLVPGISGIYPV